MENIAKKEMAKFENVLKTMSMDDIKQYVDLLNAEMEARKALHPKVGYKHDCHGCAQYHMNKYKHWCKHVTRVDRSKTDGYAFIGEFLNPANEHAIAQGAVVVEVCGKDYFAYRVTGDFIKELIAEGKRGSLYKFIAAVDAALKEPAATPKQSS